MKLIKSKVLRVLFLAVLIPVIVISTILVVLHYSKQESVQVSFKNPNFNTGIYTTKWKDTIYFYDGRNAGKGIYRLDKDNKSKYITNTNGICAITANDDYLFYALNSIPQRVYCAELKKENPKSKILMEIRKSSKLLATSQSVFVYITSFDNRNGHESSGIERVSTDKILNFLNLRNESHSPDEQKVNNVVSPLEDDYVMLKSHNLLDKKDQSLLMSISGVNVANKGYFSYNGKLFFYDETHMLYQIDDENKTVLFEIKGYDEYLFGGFYEINGTLYAIAQKYKQLSENLNQAKGHVEDILVKIDIEKKTLETMYTSKSDTWIVMAQNNTLVLYQKGGRIFKYNLLTKTEKDLYYIPKTKLHNILFFEPCGDFLFTYERKTFNGLLFILKSSEANCICRINMETNEIIH